MTDEQRITRKITEIAATANEYPGVVIVLDGSGQRVLYMSERGLGLLHTTLAEVVGLGDQYHAHYFNLEEAHEYVPRLIELLQRNHLDYTVSFFQQVRTGPERKFELYLTTARVLAQNLAGQPLLLLCLACRIEPGSHITGKVQRLLDENAFLRQNAVRFASLTARERQVLAGLARGHSSGGMAEELHISPQTVDTHRRNLRQKLGAFTAFELGQYARAFDLI